MNPFVPSDVTPIPTHTFDVTGKTRSILLFLRLSGRITVLVNRLASLPGGGASLVDYRSDSDFELSEITLSGTTLSCMAASCESGFHRRGFEVDLEPDMGVGLRVALDRLAALREPVQQVGEIIAAILTRQNEAIEAFGYLESAAVRAIVAVHSGAQSVDAAVQEINDHDGSPRASRFVDALRAALAVEYGAGSMPAPGLVADTP